MSLSPDLKTTGVKFDAGKIRIELIPPEFILAVATILTVGAIKYADRNWELGMKWSRVYGAMLRHLLAWWGNKTARTTHSFLFGPLDLETGYSHLWHAGACLAFLISYEERNIGEDDRVDIPSHNS